MIRVVRVGSSDHPEAAGNIEKFINNNKLDVISVSYYSGNHNYGYVITYREKS